VVGLPSAVDVVAVGHVLVDLRFLVDRFPGPDEEARILDERRGVGGSAANVAIAVRRLGHSSAVIAKVGLDSFARVAVDDLIREGVDISGIRVSPTSPTGFSVVVRDRGGRIIIYGFKGASEELEPREVDEELIGRARCVHIASLRPDTSLHIARRARELGKIVSWDPGRVLASMGLPKLSRLLENVDIVLVNRYEAKEMTGADRYEEAAKVVAEHGPWAVVVKLGADGCYALVRNRVLRLPAYPVEKVVDTTGAGDAFAAGLLVGLVRGWSFEDSLHHASIVAALKVARLGSHAAPRKEEVMQYAEKIGVKLPTTT